MCHTRFLAILLVFLISLKNSSCLLYPSATSISLVASVSMPLAEFFPERRILIDWCFSIAYDLPNSVSAFYTIPIWPGFANYKAKRDVPRNHTGLDLYAKYGRDVLAKIHPKDFSAGELYEGIEDVLKSYGFHESCLLRSVCELAKHPFDDNHQHLLSDIVTFILSPSQHEGFLDTESIYQHAYEEAELHGFLGKDCSLLYAYCKDDILRAITKVMFPND